jgi:RimJ/RimL family protein N-acetyltransferase
MLSRAGGTGSTMFEIRNHAKHVYFRLAEIEDAALILKLRHQDNVKDYLSAGSQTVAEQEDWLREYKKREAADQEFYFVIVEYKDDRPVGVVRFHDIDDEGVTGGSWAMLPDAIRTAGIESCILVFENGFFGLHKKFVRCTVLQTNQKLLDFHSGYGGWIKSEDEHEKLFEIDLPTYEEIFKQRYKRFYREEAFQ